MCASKCVFSNLLPCHYLCLLCVYVIHELDLHAPMLVCACVDVCVCHSMQGESDKVLVHFPRFTNHFHGLTTQSDIFSYNRVQSLDDSLHYAYAFILCLTVVLMLVLRPSYTCPAQPLLLFILRRLS